MGKARLTAFDKDLTNESRQRKFKEPMIIMPFMTGCFLFCFFAYDFLSILRLRELNPG